MKCLIAGSTGLVGKELLNELINDPRFVLTTAIARKPLGIQNQKVETIISTFEQLESTPFPPADVAFCSLGTTIKKAGSKEAFYDVDHNLIIDFAKASLKAGVKTFIVVSALGADPESKIFYNQVKGQTEVDLKRIGFKNLFILRPSLLLGKRSEERTGEKIAQMLSPLLGILMIGPLAKSRPIEALKVARKMKSLALDESLTGVNIILNHEI